MLLFIYIDLFNHFHISNPTEWVPIALFDDTSSSYISLIYSHSKSEFILAHVNNIHSFIADCVFGVIHEYRVSSLSLSLRLTLCHSLIE